MPIALSVRPSRSASAETTLSRSSKITWSRVSKRIRQELEEERLQPRDRERDRDQETPTADFGEHQFHQFAERLHLGAAELVGRAGLGFIFQRRDDGRGDVADEHRLEARRAAADQRQRRRDARHGGEAIEEAVLRTEQDRRPEDHGLRHRGFHRRFARRLGARIGRLRVRIGADRRDMHELGAALGGGLGDGAGALLPARLRMSAGRSRNKIPARFTIASASSAALATDSGNRRLACTAWICPTMPSGCRKLASSGRRTATRIRQPPLASARTRCRPKNPEPP